MSSAAGTGRNVLRVSSVAFAPIAAEFDVTDVDDTESTDVAFAVFDGAETIDAFAAPDASEDGGAVLGAATAPSSLLALAAGSDAGSTCNDASKYRDASACFPSLKAMFPA
jgi:hypothetical protein